MRWESTRTHLKYHVDPRTHCDSQTVVLDRLEAPLSNRIQRHTIKLARMR